MSTRASLHTQERLQIEREIAAADAKRAYDQQAPARASAAVARAEECRQNARKLVTDASASADLLVTPYDGRFASAEEVTTAIQAAFAEFMSKNNLTTVQLARLKAVLGFQQLADLTRVEVWETAWDYVADLTEPKAEPAPVSVLQESAEEVCPFPPNSRGREEWDRKKYAQELTAEVLTDKLFSDCMDEICNQGQKSISGTVQLQFRKWLSSPEQRRRFGASTRRSIRLGFSAFVADQSFLTDSELASIDGNRAVEQMSSDDLKRAVGFRASYDPANETYRASR